MVPLTRRYVQSREELEALSKTRALSPVESLLLERHIAAEEGRKMSRNGVRELARRGFKRDMGRFAK
jgi:hypothetical protein